MYRTGNGEYFPALFGGEACADQGSAAPGGLDNQGTQAQTADQAVTLRKMFAARRAAEGIFRTQCASFRNTMCEVTILGRIYPVDAVTEKSDGPGAGIERSFMRGRIDTKGQAADNTETGAGQVVREFVGILYAAASRVAAADNSQCREVQCFLVADYI